MVTEPESRDAGMPTQATCLSNAVAQKFVSNADALHV